jgi:hypothetical protein
VPSVREKVLGKEGFADILCAEPFLPNATLGKAYDECFSGFTECFSHSTNKPIPVVIMASSMSENRFRGGVC